MAAGTSAQDDVWPRNTDPNASTDARARRLLQLLAKFGTVRDQSHTITAGMRVYHGVRHLHERLKMPCGSAALAPTYA